MLAVQPLGSQITNSYNRNRCSDLRSDRDSNAGKPMIHGGSGMTHYRASAVESGNPTERNRSDSSRFWRYWQTLPGLIQALTPLILGLVAGGAAGAALGQHSSALAPHPTVTVTVTASAPPPVSRSASRDASLSAYWQGPVGITSNGLNFDTKPPSSTPSGTIIYAGELYASGSTNIELAVWPNSSTPTAAQCQNWVTTHPSSSLSNVDPDMQICIKTDQGRFGLLHIESVDSTQASATATIWGT
jgi:hypothetical protein